MRVKVVEKEVLNPLADIDNIKLDLNPIPYDFEKVSLVDNTKPGAATILKFLGENLGNRRFINVQKPAGAPATANQLKKAVDADIAFLALGDCGSCSSWVVLDAIRLEKMGIPTISICSDSFIDFARALASSHGAQNLTILGVEHPIAGISEGKIKEKTAKILPSLRYILQIP
jgi:hypothetical protein